MERAAPDAVELARAVVAVVVQQSAPVPAATPGELVVLVPEAEVAVAVPSREAVAEAREEAVVPA